MMFLSNQNYLFKKKIEINKLIIYIMNTSPDTYMLAPTHQHIRMITHLFNDPSIIHIIISNSQPSFQKKRRTVIAKQKR